jgi:predicted O-linked N-acetylglucosamine transferase (SPINDLY family)
VAASLLRAVGLPELIVSSLEDYEALALKLAREPESLDRLRSKLEACRETAPLFDTVRYTRHLEAAFTVMHERLGQGKPPGPLKIDPLDRS